MEYRVLGPLEVSGPGGRITLEGRRERAVLTALIMARGDVMSTDRLLDAVWGDAPPRSAAKSVQNHVLRLRKVLGTGAIETREPGYCLVVEPGDIDADQFETLIRAGRAHATAGDHDAAIDSFRAARALWRGRPLQELEQCDDAVTEATRLSELHRAAAEELVDAELACGRHAEAVAELEAMVAGEPLRERRWAMLMLALYRSGRQADALRTYQRARTLLGDELGIEPGPELRALEVAIATQDASLDLAARRNGDRPVPDDDPTDPTAEPPYKGLIPFEPEDADLFFGRELVVDELVARIRSSRFLAVVGASGSGKSSVLRAGLLASLRTGAFPGSADWVTTVMTPTAHPSRAAADHGALGAGAGAPAIVVIDQFEELFTLCRDDDERRAFIAALVATVTAPSSAVTVVIALRADFYGHCAAYPELRQLIESNTCLLGPMDPAELMAAIDGPANVAGLRLERGLGELVVREVALQPGALPLLSHALLETWRRRQGRTLTIDAYLATGGVDGAIATTAESLYEALDGDEQRIARAMFLRLTEPGDGTEDTRRRVALTELVAGADADAAVVVLRRLADARLVTIDAECAEVAHEAVIREWPRLRGWLDDDREGLRIHRHLTYSARDWDAMARDDAELYRGPRLATAREWLARDDDARLTDVETAFLVASVAREVDEADAREEHARAQARTNRRLRVLLSGTAIALVVALIAGAFAVHQTGRANDEADTARAATERATVDGILTASSTLRDENRYLESLLLLEADRIQPSDRTTGALMSALLAEPRLVATLPVSSAGAVWPLSDGRSVVVWTNGRLERWDVARRTMTRRYPFRDFIAATMSSRGTLAVAARDGAVHFVDVTGHEAAPPIALPSATPAWNLAFTPDGSELAVVLGRIASPNTVSPAASVRLFDVATGADRSVPIAGHSDVVGVAAFTADGSRLVTGGNDGLVVVHDVATGATVGPPLDVGSIVVSLVVDPLRPRVAVGTAKIDLDVWDLDTGRRLASLDAPSAAIGSYSPDGSTLAVDGSNAVRLYSAATLVPTDDEPFAAQSGSERSMLGADGRLYVTGRAGPVTIWNPARDAGPLVRPAPGTPSYLFPMPGGRVVVAPDLADSVTLLDARTLAPLGAPLSPGPAPAVEPAFPTTFAASYYDSQRIAVVNRAGVFQLFDTASRASIGPPIDLGFTAIYAVFSRDLRTIAVGGRAGQVAIIDVAGTTPRLIHPNLVTDMNLYVTSLEFDRDGTLYAADQSHVYRFSDVRAQHPKIENLEPLARGSAATAMGMDVAPDGRTIAVGHGGSVDLYDTRTLRRLGTSIPSMNAPIGWLAFSRDGRYLVVNDTSNNVRLVDAERHRTVGPLWSGLPGAGAVFNRAGTVVGTSTPTSGALLDVDPADWRRAACALAGRNLTAAEWHRYLPGQGPRQQTCPQYP